MNAAIEPARLYTVLTKTGLQTKDPVLYQLLYNLIGNLVNLRASNNSSSDPSGTTIESIENLFQLINLGDSGISEDPIPVPGPQGSTGNPGSQGPMGQMGAILYPPDAEDGQMFPPMVGPQGNPGPTGASGPVGPMYVPMDGLDGEDGFSILSPSSGAGKLVQVVNTETGAVSTGTTTIPFDNSIPQNTEGTEFMTLAITPTNAANILYIDVTVFVTVTSTPWMIVALFQDSTADAIATVATFNNLSTAGATITFRHKMTAGTTSSTTFKVRIGPSSAATITFNGQSGARIFGGVAASSITISEVTP